MTNHKNRLAKLEEARQERGNTIKVVYADEHTPEEIEAMRQDETIGTLIIVSYADADHNEPQTELRYSNGTVKRVGIDLDRI